MKKQLIIVLFHPRTGSSMLMQTLRLLGIDIVGRFERENLPQQANPKGYFEDLEIIKKGLTAQAISKIASCVGEAVAVKTSLSRMLHEEHLSQWRYLQEIQATILIPIRHPLEVALSKQVLVGRQNKIDRFRRITLFLRDYQLEFKALAEMFLTMVPGLMSSLYVIPHALAFTDTERYVTKIADLLPVDVSEEQKTAARTNIDSSLYRYKYGSFENEEKEWDKKIGATAIYDALVGLENPWPVIQAMELKWRRNN